MSEQIEKDKIYNCDCLEDEVSPDNTGETTDGKGKEAKQLTLFGEEVGRVYAKRPPTVTSSNPIIFRDYESYIAKFQDGEKTSDDTFTPKDVYEAVLRYVGETCDLSDKVILRPFYPGGDYENAEYPENGVVIDNPPFSLLMKIIAFYTSRKIPFFLFGPGLTMGNCCKYCSVIVVSEQITFDNGAKVHCNFASNMYGDVMVMTAPRLDEYFRNCKSQIKPKPVAKIGYPDHVLSIGQMQQICKGGVEFVVHSNECEVIKGLDRLSENAHKGGLYGHHFLLNTEKMREKMGARRTVDRTIYVELSDRERKIIEKLDRKTLS